MIPRYAQSLRDQSDRAFAHLGGELARRFAPDGSILLGSWSLRQIRRRFRAVYLGIIYDNGHGVNRDYVKAREWYEKAIAGGIVVAMHSLGNLYAKGFGVNIDIDKAIEWYQKAANAGDGDAANAFARLQNTK